MKLFQPEVDHDGCSPSYFKSHALNNCLCVSSESVFFVLLTVSMEALMKCHSKNEQKNVVTESQSLMRGLCAWKCGEYFSKLLWKENVLLRERSFIRVPLCSFRKGVFFTQALCTVAGPFVCFGRGTKQGGHNPRVLWVLSLSYQHYFLLPHFPLHWV